MPNLLEMLNATAETNRLDVTELTTKVSDEKQQKTIQIIFETVISHSSDRNIKFFKFN